MNTARRRAAGPAATKKSPMHTTAVVLALTVLAGGSGCATQRLTSVMQPGRAPGASGDGTSTAGPAMDYAVRRLNVRIETEAQGDDAATVANVLRGQVEGALANGRIPRRYRPARTGRGARGGRRALRPLGRLLHLRGAGEGRSRPRLRQLAARQPDLGHQEQARVGRPARAAATGRRRGATGRGVARKGDPAARCRPGGRGYHASTRTVW